MSRKIPKSASDVIDSLAWRDYVGDRKIAEDPSGFFVIVPNNFKGKYPLFCPVCDCSMSTSDDLKAYDDVKSCDHCKEKWYYPHREKWDAGWRPTDVKCDYKKTILFGG